MISHLVNATAASYLFISDDPGFRSLWHESAKTIERQVKVLQMPFFEELFTEDPEPSPPAAHVASVDDTAFILHSSGMVF